MYDSKSRKPGRTSAYVAPGSVAVIPAAPPFSPSVLRLIQLQNDGMDLTTPAASTTCGIIFISLHRATEEKGHCNSKAYVQLAAFYYITNDVSLMPRRARTRNKTHTLPTLLSAACAKLTPVWKKMTTTLYISYLGRAPTQGHRSELELRITIMINMGTGTSSCYTRDPKEA